MMFRQTIERMFAHRFRDPRGMAQPNRANTFSDKPLEQIVDRRVRWRTSQNLVTIRDAFANESHHRRRLTRARRTVNQRKVVR